MMYHSNYFAIEGLNGIGKSTILKYVKKSLRDTGPANMTYKFFHDPIAEYEYHKEVSQDRRGISDISSALLYASSSYESQKTIGFQENISGLFLSDRSPLSTFAYYPNLDFQFLREIHRYVFLPTTIFHITAPAEFVERQLETRDINDAQRELIDNNGLDGQYRSCYSLLSGVNVVDVYNVDGDISVAVDTILEYIGRWLENDR